MLERFAADELDRAERYEDVSPTKDAAAVHAEAEALFRRTVC
ncbi:hypothetical protein [Microbacterium sp. CPCC 204701]|nr:hypothetical protein [Microbacterium sp. CPCC 204701]